MERFLITGLPRIRSAWLTALLTAVGADVTHESLTGPPFFGGWCDPTAACVWPEEAAKWIDSRPCVFINRNPLECRVSWEKWAGVELGNWQEICTNVAQFSLLTSPVVIEYKDLEEYSTVAHIVKYCVGRYLPKYTWRVFNNLKIEQHLAKAQAYAQR